MLGNSGGNETRRDRVSLLRQDGTTQVPAVVLASSNASSRDRSDDPGMAHNPETEVSKRQIPSAPILQRTNGSSLALVDEAH